MKIRPYNREADFTRIYNFLVETYQPGEVLHNWLAPRWEYAHFHPSILELDLSRFGIAEEEGQIIGVVHFESNQAEVICQVRPGYEHIRTNLLNYTEEIDYRGMSRSRNKPFRVVFVYDHDTEFAREVAARGYEKWPDFGEVHSAYPLDKEVPAPTLPEGYKLQSLADENDFAKINQVLWRGFNHPGDPPEKEIEGRKVGQQAPNFRKDLTIVAVAPNGNYVSYCGMYYVPENKVAYLEPLATDPDYRRMGMAKAAVLESMRRVQTLGAEICWVGSGQLFYTSIGFEIKFTIYPWAMLFE
jgi:predicted N-acetyltransferase YhbS